MGRVKTGTCSVQAGALEHRLLSTMQKVKALDISIGVRSEDAQAGSHKRPRCPSKYVLYKQTGRGMVRHLSSWQDKPCRVLLHTNEP